MRVAIDYTPALRQGAGIGRYTRGLVAGLAEQALNFDVTLLHAIDATRGSRQTAHIPPLFRQRVLPLPLAAQAILWHRLHVPLPLEWLCGPMNLFHATDFLLPPLQRARGVITVHDLSFLRVPECADPGLRAYLANAVPRAIGTAQRILADSENTRRDLAELLDVDPGRVDVVYPGVSAHFKPITNAQVLAEVRERYHLPGPFILSLGTLEPRKNFSGLIAAFAELRRTSHRRHNLVIAGGKGWLSDAIFEAVRQQALGDSVHFAGYVAETDLPALYSLADLFVFPSLYEGFGIPIIEAMACGTPVVCANNSSLPEAAGEAALLVDAYDRQGLAQAMAQVLQDETVAADLRARGIRQAARFSWTAAAGSLIQAYERVFASIHA